MGFSMEMMNFGKHCSNKSCRQIDFLPFECSYCKEPYCIEHWKPEGHSCEHVKHDEKNILPVCQLCKRPIGLEANDNPNEPMEDHLLKRCKQAPTDDLSVDLVWLREKQKRLRSNVAICDQAKCSNKLFSAAKCDACGKAFCMNHRFPTDHQCKGSKNKSSQSTSHVRVVPARFWKQKQEEKAFEEAVNAPRQDKQETPTASTMKAPHLFGKYKQVEKRVQAERESRIKALQFRASKGLLSEQDKIELATYQAKEGQFLKTKNQTCPVQ